MELTKLGKILQTSEEVRNDLFACDVIYYVAHIVI